MQDTHKPICPDCPERVDLVHKAMAHRSEDRRFTRFVVKTTLVGVLVYQAAGLALMAYDVRLPATFFELNLAVVVLTLVVVSPRITNALRVWRKGG